MKDTFHPLISDVYRRGGFDLIVTMTFRFAEWICVSSLREKSKKVRFWSNMGLIIIKSVLILPNFQAEYHNNLGSGF